MKDLLIGNAAVARGLYEAGCAVISSYPGTPSTEITEFFAKYNDAYCEWVPNEKVAMEAPFGSALRGKRSACCMKHVGLNVAADPLFTMSYTGVNAGIVICVADDPGMHSSQNEQDSRHYAIAAKIPMLEPSDSQEALDFAKLAYEISEQFDTPVLLKMCTRVALPEHRGAGRAHRGHEGICEESAEVHHDAGQRDPPSSVRRGTHQKADRIRGDLSPQPYRRG